MNDCHVLYDRFVVVSRSVWGSTAQRVSLLVRRMLPIARTQSLQSALLILLLLTLAGCGPGNGESSAADESTRTASSLSQVVGYDLVNVPSQVNPGATVTIGFIAPLDHSADDWIGIFSVGAANYAYEGWVRVPSGASGTVSLSVRVLTSGAHEFRYFIGKSYNLAATSATFNVSGSAGTYALTAIPSMAAPGSSVTLTVTAPASHSTNDWIGLYSVGASIALYQAWAFVPAGTTTRVTLTIPRLALGTYEFRYFVAATYEVVATSSWMGVSGTPGSYSLSQVPNHAAPGDGVRVQFSAPATHSDQDWIGLYVVGAAAGDYESWAKVPAGSSATVLLTVPLTASGAHEFRYFVGPVMTDRAATSASFTVAGTPGSYALTGLSASVEPGTSVSVQFAAPATHSTLDWIGIYPVGADDSASEGGVTVPAGATGSVNLLARIHASGSHELRYFVGDTYELATKSAVFDVTGAIGDYSVVDVPVHARPGRSIEVTYSAPGNHSGDDWIGLYPIGSGSGDFVAWTPVPAGANGAVALEVPTSASGDFECRYLVGFQTDVVATSASVQVAPPRVITDETTYLASEPVVVTWVGGLDPDERLAIARAGSSEPTPLYEAMTNGAWSGNHVFSAVPPGSYELRYYDGAGQKLATAQLQVVGPLTTPMSHIQGYSLVNAPAQVIPGATATVGYVAPTDHFADDWIGIFAVGAANHSNESWVRVPPGPSGTVSVTVDVRASGAHEFRYYVGKSYRQAATSTTFSVTGSAGTYALTGAPTASNPGRAIAVNYSAPATHSTSDWIGLYQVGASISQIKAWAFVSAANNGTVELTVPRSTVSGWYELRYVVAATYETVAYSAAFSISGGAGVYALSQVPSGAGPGDGVTVSFSAPATHSDQDWIGLYALGADAKAYESWARVPAGSNGTVLLTVPLSATGQHEFRYFVGPVMSDQAAASAAFPITGSRGNYALSGVAAVAAPGSSVTVQFTAPATHSTLDWIGIYPVGAQNSASEGGMRVPAGATGSVNLLVRIHASGPHELRYFVGDTYELAATSAAFDVVGSIGSYLVIDVPARARNGGLMQVGFSAPADHSDQDWIGLFPVGSGSSDYVAWSMVSPGATGTVSLDVPAGVTGEFECRYLVGFAADLVATSPAVQIATASVSTTTTQNFVPDPVIVTWLGGMAVTDQIAIVPAGTVDATPVATASTNGQWTGSATFASLPTGAYEARLVDGASNVAATSPQFRVMQRPTVSTSKSAYLLGEPVAVMWSAPPDWPISIGLAPLGASDFEIVAWGSTADSIDGVGSYSFLGIPAGIYQAGLYVIGPRVATSPPFVVGLTTWLDKSSYAVGDSVVVNWGSPFVVAGKLVVAPLNSDASSVQASVDVDASTGSYVFSGLPAGAYELRLFDSASQLIYNGNSFVVTAPVTISVEKSQYYTGQHVRIHWTGCQSRGDWIAVTRPFSTTYLGRLETNGLGTGVREFGGFGPEASYVPRYYDGNDRLVATGAPFTVFLRPTLNTDRYNYWAGDEVLASWSGALALEGRIVVAPTESPAEVATASVNISGGLMGNHAFVDLPPGIYELRFFDDASTRIASSTTFPVVQPPSASVSKANYLIGEPVTVNLSGPAHYNDLVAIAAIGAPDSAVAATFTTNGDAGPFSFWGIPEGLYEARFLAASGRLLGTTAPFEVAALTVGFDKPSYAVGDSVTVNWDCPFAVDGRLVVAPLNSDASTVQASVDVEASTGSYVFSGLPAGVYELRVLDDAAQEIYNGNSFVVTGPVMLATDKSQYFAGQTIGVQWTGCQSRSDTVAIAVAGSPESEILATASTNGSGSGIQVFGALQKGTYVARYFDDTSHLAAASANFTVVAAPVLTVDKAKYLTGDRIFVRWSADLPMDGRIVVAPVDSSAGTVIAAIPISGTMAGNSAFTDLQDGAYEVRFLDTTATVVAISGTFTVSHVVVATDKNQYNSSELVTVTWQSLLDANGRLEIAPVGSTLSTASASIDVGPGSGSYVFSGVELGVQEVRYFDASNQLRATSAEFEVRCDNARDLSPAAGVSVGAYSSCELGSDGRVRCWGNNQDGTLGDGTRTSSLSPVEVWGLRTASALDGGGSHACAIANDGRILCWGANWAGELGDGSNSDSLSPVEVLGISDAVAVSAGSSHTCAIRKDGRVSCWGYNGSGAIGDGTNTNANRPVEVQGISNAVTISAGGRHSCASSSDGRVYCWGHNEYGQLGDGTQTNRYVPVEIQGISTAISVSAGQSHTCAVLSDGGVQCWGANWSGQLGDGTPDAKHTPTNVTGIRNARMVSAGTDHSCAVDDNARAWCWGANWAGQLGIGTFADSLGPAAVQGLASAAAVSAGYDHTCALLSGGQVSCWGRNSSGQLGNGMKTDSAKPVRVLSIACNTASSISLTTDRPNYVTGTPVTINWSGSRSPRDRIVIAPIGSTLTTVEASISTGSNFGSYAFSGIPGGTYELRFFDYASNLLAVSAPFEVIQLSSSVDKTTYNVGDSVVVSWSSDAELEGRLVVALVGSDAQVATASSNVQAASGSVAFEGISGGVYEVRFLDADSQLFFTGDSFMVVESVTLEADPSRYFVGQDVKIRWTGCQSRNDWIVLAYADSSTWSYFAAGATDGRGSGVMSLGTPSEGRYVARYFDEKSRLVATTPAFSIVSAPTLTLDNSRYLLGDDVTVGWSAAMDTNGRVAVAPAGSTIESAVASVLVRSELRGSHTFTNLPLGDYELRFFDDSSTWLATSPTFKVASVVIDSDHAKYTVGDPIVAIWRSVLATGGRVVVAPSGADASSETASAIVASGSGNHTFDGIGFGTYELRYFDDASQPVATSTPFVVATEGAAVTTDKPRYFAGQTITVRWTGYESPSDWIGIGPATASDGESWWASSTGGEQTGEFVVGWGSEGTFQARYYDGDAHRVATSSDFTVYPAPALSTDKSWYLVGDPVIGNWSAGIAMDGQVVLAQQGASPDTIVNSLPVAGSTNGSHTFTDLPVGDYELRYFDSQSNWLNTSPGFRVSPVVLASDKTGYGVEDPVVVTWRNTIEPGGQLVIAPLGSDPSTVTASTNVGMGSGTYTFTGLPVGDYEVRFVDSSSTVVASTGSFSVYVRLVASKTIYAPNGFIVAEWRDCPVDPANRVVIAPDGSTDETVTAEVLASSVDGAHAFGPLPAGTYRVRYFASAGAQKWLESEPVAIVLDGPTRLVQLGLGEFHSCGVTPQHEVLCWGANGNGQLGDGTTADRNAASKVLDLGSATFAASGLSSSCAVLADGTVKCWGSNWCGQLGDGTNIDRSTPVDVIGITNAVKLTMSERHGCALLADGGAQCWGCNWYGELGDGTNSDSPVPVSVVGITNAVDVSANLEGGLHTCAVLADGTVRCWGDNGNSALGDGTFNNSSLPVQVVDITNAIGVGTGGGNACAVLAGGGVKCWGYNYNGQLGDGTTNDSTAPVDVVGIGNAVSVTLGSYHSCARLNDGSARCWGYNGYGQLGDGNTSEPGAFTPVPVAGIASSLGVQAGGYHTCAIASDRSVRCWGNNSNGQLGDASVPTCAQTDGFSQVRTLSAGHTESCASYSDGHVRCWGSNVYGEVGDGTTTTRSPPTLVSGIATALDVTTGENHTCSTLSNGHVYCWGLNYNGELGGGSAELYSTDPVEIVGIANARAVNTKFYHSCAVLNDGKVTCWGANWSGQLGSGLEVSLGPVIQVAPGADATCALESIGRVLCWGGNWGGQLGNGTNSDSATPVEVTGIEDAVAIASAAWHGCAVLGDGTVRCWGANDYGQLGDGTTSYSNVPVPVFGIDNAVGIDAGDAHTCALLADDRVKCWGDNESAQLGDGTTRNRPFPIEVGGFVNAQAIMVGHQHTCVLHGAGNLRCWGYNGDGELGDGLHPYSVAPVTVQQRE